MVHDHASYKDYHDLAAMIDAGIQALSAARALLHRLEDRPGTPIDPGLSKLFSSPEVFIPPRTRKPMGQDRRLLPIIDRLVALMPRAGRNGVAILLRLLDEPGFYVSREELVRAAGIRTADAKAVKVYICNLRHALRLVGIPADAIETGRRSYRLVPDSAAAIRLLMNGDPHSHGGSSINASSRTRQAG